MTRKFPTGVVWVLSLLLGCGGPSHLRHPALQEPARGIYHEVQKGETLWRISQSYQVPIQEIISVNKLTDPDRLVPGQLLFIPTVSPPEERPRGRPSSSLPRRHPAVSVAGEKPT